MMVGAGPTCAFFGRPELWPLGVVGDLRDVRVRYFAATRQTSPKCDADVQDRARADAAAAPKGNASLEGAASFFRLGRRRVLRHGLLLRVHLLLGRHGSVAAASRARAPARPPTTPSVPFAGQGLPRRPKGAARRAAYGHGRLGQRSAAKGPCSETCNSTTRCSLGSPRARRVSSAIANACAFNFGPPGCGFLLRAELFVAASPAAFVCAGAAFLRGIVGSWALGRSRFFFLGFDACAWFF